MPCTMLCSVLHHELPRSIGPHIATTLALGYAVRIPVRNDAMYELKFRGAGLQVQPSAADE
jgi:hypothetical protein